MSSGRMRASTIRRFSSGTISMITSRGPITEPAVNTFRPTTSPAIGEVIFCRAAASFDGRIRSSRSKMRVVVSFSSSLAEARLVFGHRALQGQDARLLHIALLEELLVGDQLLFLEFERALLR